MYNGHTVQNTIYPTKRNSDPPNDKINSCTTDINERKPYPPRKNL